MSGLVVGWLVVVEVVDAGMVEYVVEYVVMGVGSGWCPVPWAMCRVVAAPPARRHPTGFAGVSFATVLGLVVGLSSRGRNVACWWSSSVSMVCSTRVFDVVDMVADRGVGCPGGRRWCRWRRLRWCSMSWA